MSTKLSDHNYSVGSLSEKFSVKTEILSRFFIVSSYSRIANWFLSCLSDISLSQCSIPSCQIYVFSVSSGHPRDILKVVLVIFCRWILVYLCKLVVYQLMTPSFYHLWQFLRITSTQGSRKGQLMGQNILAWTNQSQKQSEKNQTKLFSIFENSTWYC